MSKNTKRTPLQQATDQFIDANKQPNQTRKQYVEELREGVKAGNLKALDTLNDLKNLIVKKIQQETILNIRDEFLNKFIFKAPDGNGVQYIKHFIRPGKQFNANEFIPTAKTEFAHKSHFVKFKEDNGNLATNSKQWMWSVVIQKSELITYFLSGQMTEFIASQINEQLDQSIKVYFYHNIMEFLKNIKNVKTINGTATNLFDALTLEILPEINKMRLNTNAYNIDQNLTEAIDSSKREDLILMKNVKTDTILKSHIMSQLFNSNKIELSDYVGQQHTSNYQFNLGGDVVGTNADYYVPEDEIWVIDTANSIKTPIFLDESGNQEFVNNMSYLSVHHIWFTIDALPWGKMFKYKNANLNNSPANP